MNQQLTRKQVFLARLHKRYRENPPQQTRIEVLEELLKSLGATQEEIDAIKPQ